MRLFIGLEIDSQICERIDLLTAQLKPLARLKWSPPENLHITTKFVGDWPGDRLADLCDRMPAAQQSPQVTVSGIGFFPNDRYSKVLFARVEPSPELTEIARLTDAAVQDLGIPAEKFPYRPHVTLARIPEAVLLHGLRERLDQLQPGHFGTFRPAAFSIFESRGGRYTKLQSFPLLVPAR